MQATMYVDLDGDRRLAWTEYGHPDGRPVLLFHGGNDSRLVGAMLAEAARRGQVRLVCADRPGFGRSTFQAGRRFTDWPKDVAALADELGLERFAVVGHSGGGPHALACAVALPDRVSWVSTVSSVAPPEASNAGLHPAFRAVNVLMASRRAYAPMARSQLKQMRGSTQRWLQMWGRMQPADGELFDRRPDMRDLLVAEMDEGAHQGVDGIVLEAALYHRDWGFDLRSVSAPTSVWHGGRDRQAAVAWAQYLAATIPGATLTMVAASGHFSTLVDHAQAILAGPGGADGQVRASGSP